MAIRTERSIHLSVLDRLIDNEPKRTSEVELRPAQSLEELKASLRRDLEWLLNTRQPLEEPPEGSKELEQSLYNYGLPDICSMSLASVKDRYRLARLMESTLSKFEPRLEGVRVTLMASAESSSRVLKFQIEGLLRVEPAPERVTFDTILELTSGEYEVKGERGAG
jgi:type VI secretion system protein ImpF